MSIPFYRWHPEVALRYLPVVEIIKKNKPVNLLEVGSGSLGIAPYLRRSVTGVDLSFSGPTLPYLKQVKGNAQKLPFPKRSFDAVVAVDVLEHIEPEKRANVVAEMIRVAERLVIIAVPVGKEAEDEDRELSALYRKRFGVAHPFLKNHLTYGLPKDKEVIFWLENAFGIYDRRGIICDQQNESIWLHRFLMRGWMSDSILTNFIFRKVLLFAIGILRMINKSPAYRRIYVVTLK